MIRVRAVAFDETRFCAFEDHELKIVDKVIDVHIYCPDEFYDTQSSTGSWYELPWLYTELRFQKHATVEETMAVDFDLSQPCDWLYKPASEIDQLPFVDCGMFHDMSEALTHLRACRPEIP
jgi:hypothetical protein